MLNAGASTSSRLSASTGQSGGSGAASPAAEKSSTRLYVGNLHPSVDEYTLIQVYSKHGKVAKLDFLFHKSGPQKGKPRGYAFVEYATTEEAMQALVATNDKMLRGRKLSVTFANKSDYAEGSSTGGAGGGVGPHRNRQGEITKPTTLSLIKNAQKPKSTNAKIAAMEAKLKLLQEKKSSKNARGSAGGDGGGGSNSVLPIPPSSAGLPSRPPPALPDFERPVR